MTDKPLPSILELTPLNESYRVDPHGMLDDLRSRCPVHRDTVSGSTLFTRYADVRAAVNDRGLWRDPLLAERGQSHRNSSTPSRAFRCRCSSG